MAKIVRSSQNQSETKHAAICNSQNRRSFVRLQPSPHLWNLAFLALVWFDARRSWKDGVHHHICWQFDWQQASKYSTEFCEQVLERHCQFWILSHGAGWNRWKIIQSQRKTTNQVYCEKEVVVMGLKDGTNEIVFKLCI